MPSFDAVVEPNRVELRNAIDQCVREIGTRFDFKGTKAAVEYDEDALTLVGDSDFQIGQVRDIVLAKLAKRNVDARFVDFSADARESRRRHLAPDGADQVGHRRRRRQAAAAG